MFTNITELAAWLAEHEIDTAVWGQENSKTIANLWQEIQLGETRLQSNPPRRLVQVVEVIVQREDQMLIEAAQELADGRMRQRRLPPSEKFKPGEDAHQAALRCLQEEVAIPAEAVQILNISPAPRYNEQNSRSYPGLITRYAVFRVQTAVPNLPTIPFTIQNNAQTQHDPIRAHHWAWAPLSVNRDQ